MTSAPSLATKSSTRLHSSENIPITQNHISKFISIQWQLTRISTLRRFPISINKNRWRHILRYSNKHMISNNDDSIPITWIKIICCLIYLTHWGRVTHICVSRLTITGSDNGLSPGRRQAIIRTNAGILLIRPLGTNFSEYFCRNSNIFIQENAFESVVCEKAAILYRPQWVN